MLGVLALAAAMTCAEPARDGYQILVYLTCEPELVIAFPPDVVLKPLGPEVWPAPGQSSGKVAP